MLFPTLNSEEPFLSINDPSANGAMGRCIMKQVSQVWDDEIEAGAFTPGLVARDGESVAGERGHLRIALRVQSLRLRFGEPKPTYWLLPLNSVEMVRLSANLPGELLWVSPRRPQSLVGLFVGDFRGAWWEGGLAMIKNQDAVEVYFAAPQVPGAGSLKLLAQIMAVRWGGWPPARIHAALRLKDDAACPTASGVSNSTAQLAGEIGRRRRIQAQDDSQPRHASSPRPRNLDGLRRKLVLPVSPWSSEQRHPV